MSSSSYNDSDNASAKPSSEQRNSQRDTRQQAIREIRKAAAELSEIDRKNHEATEEYKKQQLGLYKSMLNDKPSEFTKSQWQYFSDTIANGLQPESYEEKLLREEYHRDLAIDRVTGGYMKLGYSKKDSMKLFLDNLLSEARSEVLDDKAMEEGGPARPKGTSAEPSSPTPNTGEINAIMDILGGILTGTDHALSELVDEINRGGATPRSNSATPVQTSPSPGSATPTPAAAYKEQYRDPSTTRSFSSSDEDVEVIFEERDPDLLRPEVTRWSSSTSSEAESSTSELTSGSDDIVFEDNPIEETPFQAIHQQLPPTDSSWRSRERSMSWPEVKVGRPSKPTNTPLSISRSSPDFRKLAGRDITNLVLDRGDR